jgi:hypothetical protein
MSNLYTDAGTNPGRGLSTAKPELTYVPQA